MKGIGMGVLALSMLGWGCGSSSGSAWKCADEAARFMPASVPVDRSKAMSALTADEQAAVCAEFSRALTASYYATPELTCRSNSPNPRFQGTAVCQTAYGACLQSSPPPPPTTIPYCTDKMSIWDCPITIGQYQDCFNDFNAAFFAVEVKLPACAVPDANTCGTPPPSPACAAAPCDYVWYD
jgi:hypothetical protein